MSGSSKFIWDAEMLNVQNIHQYYGGSHILRDVSLTAQPGQITVLRYLGYKTHSCSSTK